MIKCDYHMHTNYSSDSSASMESMILGSINKGMKSIAITDHFDLEAPVTSYIDYTKYYEDFSAYKEKYKNQIDIAFGIEFGFTPETFFGYSDYVKPHPFDFIICSTHSISFQDDIFFGFFHEDKEKLKAYNNYFERILQTIGMFKGFSVYGHFDYVSRYGHFSNKDIYFKEHTEILEKIFKTLIENGKGFEINTSYFKKRKNIIDFYKDLVKRYREMGGEIITVGSDAHDPSRIASGFSDAYSILKDAGFNYVTKFNKMRPIFEKI